MDLSDLREYYQPISLRRSNLKTNPLDQFKLWFEQAEQAGIPEPNAMVLSTVDEDERPWQRTVLLKAIDKKGFIFFTHLSSRKAKQIKHSTKSSLLFLWVSQARQVILTGDLEPVEREIVESYFAKRPRENQLGAWVSHQSQEVDGRQKLETELQNLEKKYQSQKIPTPDFWGGYRLIPKTFEFWQGGKGRIHDRFFYEHSKVGSAEWKIKRLAP